MNEDYLSVPELEAEIARLKAESQELLARSRELTRKRGLFRGPSTGDVALAGRYAEEALAKTHQMNHLLVVLDRRTSP